MSNRIDDLYLIVNDLLFRNIFQAERQLKDYTQQKRGEKKPRAGGDTDDERNQIP